MAERPMPEVAGVEHRWVELDGFRAHLAEAGAGPPVVLLHGWPQHWYEWREVIAPLAAEHRVLAPDLRGFGWSETPGGGYDPRTFMRDVIALLDAEGIDRADFIGHDWGGYVGFLVALEAPQRLRRMIALNILPPFLPASSLAYRSLWRFWYQWTLAMPLAGPWIARSLSLPPQPLARWLGGAGAGWDDATRHAFFDQFREPERARATTALYRSAQRELLAAARGGKSDALLEVPTRLVFGTGDKVLDHRLLDGIERFGTDFEVELVEGVGHMIVDERPDLVVDRARAFFGR